MKSKLVKQQEFVVGGWTEPRQTRQHFGALLLGVHKEGDTSGKLTYVGHTGTGFDQRELERVSKLLKSREIAESPFAERFKTNEPAHWARPDLVAQVRFTEWTAETSCVTRCTSDCETIRRRREVDVKNVGSEVPSGDSRARAPGPRLRQPVRRSPSEGGGYGGRAGPEHRVPSPDS